MKIKISDLTPDELEEIETLEEKYLNRFYHFLMYAKDELFKGFETANETRGVWKKNWDSTDFDTGAERIVYSFFNTQGFGVHNSSPVGSDMFFETENAFIHIDLKTVRTTNLDDASIKHDIEKNQSSYRRKYKLKRKPYSERTFYANLPTEYNVNEIKKYCLTYFLVIVFERDDFSVPCMYITCMPNGLLEKTYGEKILGAGKKSTKDDKKNNARFHWNESENFELLVKKNVFEDTHIRSKRIRVIHFDGDDSKQNKKCEHIKKAPKKCTRCRGTGNKKGGYLEKKLAKVGNLYKQFQ